MKLAHQACTYSYNFYCTGMILVRFMNRAITRIKTMRWMRTSEHLNLTLSNEQIKQRLQDLKRRLFQGG